MARFRKSVAIDLGSSSVLVYVNNKKLVLEEPSVIAKDILTGKILAVGKEAKKLLGRTPANIVAVKPIKDGIISDMKSTEEMLKYFLKKSLEKTLFKPEVLISVPSKATQVEKRAVFQAAEAAGASRAYLIEASLSAALGAGVDISDAGGSLVVDIGGGTTDIALVSLGQIVISNSVDIGGEKFDSYIKDHIRNKYQMLIGETSAEEIKIAASGKEMTDSVEVKGRRIADGLPSKIYLPVNEIYQALLPAIKQIVEGVKYILEATPPELAADLYDRGIILTGGGSLTIGLCQKLAEELQINARIAEDATHCVIDGTSKALTWIETIDEEKNESIRAKQKQLERKERMRRR
ncbi:MAG: rod shape-determining protein [Peptoniphilaceae bacterium]|nr:rod shape-determining protein [Peptoniphilaceae bacterium]MDY6018706.1 rod shape-determining protein [Anaerococcus sp.]